jgi:hypothetical protein
MAKKLHLNAPNIVDDLNQIHSIFPCTGYITFGPWIYMVPQYTPKSVLMLGYGGGTTAGLIRIFHGDVPITAVDQLDCSEFNYYNVTLIQSDANEYIKTAPQFDCVIVDLYNEGSYQSEPFTFTTEFADRLGEIANYIIFHGVVGDDMSAYDRFYKVRSLRTNNGTKYDPEIHYYMVNDIPSLPVR